MVKSNTLSRRHKIKQRIRRIISGNAQRPRLCVYRSNKEIYAQLINDDSATVLSASSSQKLDKSGKNKTEIAKEVGAQIAQAAAGAGITQVVFDRNGYLYHGRVKALADAARENGLQF